MASLFRRVAGCPHCNDLRADGKREAKCLVDISTFARAVCYRVQDPSDVRPGWEYVKPSDTPELGGIVRRVDENGEDKATARLRAMLAGATADAAADAAAADDDTAAAVAAAKEEAARHKAATADYEAKRRAAQTTALKGLPPIHDPVEIANIRGRIHSDAGAATDRLMEAGLLRALPDRAIPALANTPGFDKDGRSLAEAGQAIAFSFGPRGEVLGAQLVASDRLRKIGRPKYSFLASSHRGDDVDSAVQVTAEGGGVDKLPLFAPEYAMAFEAVSADVFVVDSALKPSLAALNMRARTIGTPGAMHRAAFRQILRYLKELEQQLGIRPRVLLTPDAGDVSNAHIITSLMRTYDQLWASGYEAAFCWYGQGEKGEGKDFDEVTPAELGGLSFSYLTRQQMLGLLPPEVQKQSQRQLRRQTRRGIQQLSPDDQDNIVFETSYGSPEVEFFEPGKRTEKLLELQERGIKLVLDTTPVGGGKTYWAGHCEPEQLHAVRLLVSSPTAMTFAHEFGVERNLGWKPIRGRDVGRLQTRDDRIVRAQSVNDEGMVYAPNCKKAEEFDYLHSANAGAAIAAICGSCEHNIDCNLRPGWYLADRAIVEDETKVVAHPLAIQARNDLWNDVCSKFRKGNGSQPGTVLLADEVDSFPWVSSCFVSWVQIGQTLKQLGPAMPPWLLSAVRRLLDCRRPTGYEVVWDRDLRKNVFSHVPKGAMRSGAEAIAREELNAVGQRRGVFKCWLPEFITYLSADDGQVSYVSSKGIHFCTANKQVTETFQSSALKQAVLFDATGVPEEVELRLGQRVVAIQERLPKQVATVRNIQVYGLGNTGYGRNAQVQMLLRRVRPLLQTLSGVAEEQTGWLDIKAALDEYGPNQRVGAFMASSRGSNFFKDCQALYAIGIPIANISARAAEFALLSKGKVELQETVPVVHRVLTSEDDDETAFGFFTTASADTALRQWQHHSVLKELKQAAGRTRANRRPGEEIVHVFVGDFALPWEVELVHVRELVGDGLLEQLRRLSVQAINGAWQRLDDGHRTLPYLAEALKVDKALLAERLLYPDLVHQPCAAHAKRFLPKPAQQPSPASQRVVTSGGRR